MEAAKIGLGIMMVVGLWLSGTLWHFGTSGTFGRLSKSRVGCHAPGQTVGDDNLTFKGGAVGAT